MLEIRHAYLFPGKVSLSRVVQQAFAEQRTWSFGKIDRTTRSPIENLLELPIISLLFLFEQMGLDKFFWAYFCPARRLTGQGK